MIMVLVYAARGATVAAQNGQRDARLDAGAAFLKSGEIELATKTFMAVLDGDPASWQARSLLALSYLAARDLDKVGTELTRLKTQAAPPAAIEVIERQLAGARQAARLRDEITQLLHVGKAAEALSRIESIDIPGSRKQLLRAYVAALRGEFDEAARLTDTPELADFNGSVKRRAEEFAVAREQALVALNVLGERYCGDGLGEMRRCQGWPPLSPVQQSAWDVIRSGNGKVNAAVMPEKVRLTLPQLPLIEAAISARSESALEILGRFVSLAPLHHDAVYAAVVHALNSGSLDATRVAAQRSTNVLGTWVLRIRKCQQRYDYQPCTVGEEKASRLREEGWLIVDARARVLRYHTGQPDVWLSDMKPAPAASQFEIPFDQVAVIRSRPEATLQQVNILALNEESVLLDFGSGRRVPMFLDFTFQRRLGDATAVALKTIEDVVTVLGEMIPKAKTDYDSSVKTGGGFLSALGKVGAVTAIAAGGGSPSGEYVLQRERERSAAGQRATSSFSQTVAELKAQDGQSVMDAALEVTGLRQDLQALLDLALK